MVTTRGGGPGSGSSSCFGTKPINERMYFITSEISHGIMEATPVIFSTIKEGIIELYNKHIEDFRVDIMVGQLGAPTISFREFKACGDPKFFGRRTLLLDESGSLR